MTVQAMIRIPDADKMENLSDAVQAAIADAKFATHLYKLSGTRVYNSKRIFGCACETPYDGVPADQHPNPADWLDAAFAQFGLSWEAIAVQSFKAHPVIEQDEDGNDVVIGSTAISYRAVPDIKDWLNDIAIMGIGSDGMPTVTGYKAVSTMPAQLHKIAGAADWVIT